MAYTNTTGISDLERAWVRNRAMQHYRRTYGEPRPTLSDAWLWVEDLWYRATGPGG